MLKTWEFAVLTPKGIYTGSMTGEQEPEETDQEAMQAASDIAVAHVKQFEPGVEVKACIVGEGTLHIDAPKTTLVHIGEKTIYHDWKP